MRQAAPRRNQLIRILSRLAGVVLLLNLVSGSLSAQQAGDVPASSCPAPSADENSMRTLLRRTLDVLHLQDQAQQNFAWHERESRQQWNHGVKVRSKDETYDVSTVDGEQYRRLIARNGHPLSAEEDRAQQQKLADFIARHEPSNQRDRDEIAQKRQREMEREQRRREAVLRNFHFKLLGSKPTAWGPAWVIHAEPDSNASFNDQDLKMMSHFAGDLWIDAEGCHLVRLDMRVLQPIAFGWILGKVDEGGKFVITFAPIDTGNWFPQQVSLDASGRILFRHLNLNVQSSYSDYRRFQVESRLLSAVPESDLPVQNH